MFIAYHFTACVCTELGTRLFEVVGPSKIERTKTYQIMIQKIINLFSAYYRSFGEKDLIMTLSSPQRVSQLNCGNPVMRSNAKCSEKGSNESPF